VDCVTGTPSFIQINVSGGDPDEIHVKELLIVNNNKFVITGAAV